MSESRRLYRISDLARLSGLSTSTLKYYLAEGLISPKQKTGKTMFWYEPEVVDQLLLIKRLQAERFLPLAVIKQLLSSHDLSDTQIQLTRAIYRVPQSGLEEREIPHSKISQVSGYPLDRIDALTRQGILKPKTRGGVLQYDQFDLKIVEIAKEREKRGLPFEYDLKVFSAYTRSMETAVKEDIRLFISMVLGNVTTQQAVSLISDVDELLNLFLLFTRQKMSRIHSERALEELTDMGQRIVSLWPFPAEGTYLPSNPPPEIVSLLVYYLASGRFTDAADIAKHLHIQEEKRHGLQALLRAKSGEPCRINPSDETGTTDRFVKAVKVVLEFLRIRDLPGLVEPARALLEGMESLTPFREDSDKPDLFDSLAVFLSATIYLSIPVILGFRERGRVLYRKALAEFQAWFSDRKAALPRWLILTLEEEIIPSLHAKLDSLED